MKTIAISQTVNVIREDSAETTYRRLHRRWMTVLLISSIAAGVTGIFGVALAVLSLIHVIPAMGRLGLTGTFLLALTFPLMVFAAHCLDKVDDANRTYRMASYKRQILGDLEGTGSNRD